MQKVQLVVFDMAGTTVKDNDEVLACFLAAAKATGLKANQDVVNAMMGWSKRLVFEALWKQQIDENSDECVRKVDGSFAKFKEILEDYYRSQPILPTEGCLALFDWLNAQGIKIALNTGFYREVTNIILARLGWNKGLNEQYIGSHGSIIQVSITPSEIYNNEGRPAPFMIQKAMYYLGIIDSKKVIYVGDTPSDLASGKNANCLLTLGVTNGTHSKQQLQKYENDGLLDSVLNLKQIIEQLS